MKIGDYVRTNYGYIYRIKRIEKYDNKLLYISDIKEDDEGGIPASFEKDIIKSSPNIIELLEPMDLLYIDIDGGFEGGIVVPRIPETLDELNGFIEFIKSGHWVLKYVVTHEQLENDMYKVVE